MIRHARGNLILDSNNDPVPEGDLVRKQLQSIDAFNQVATAEYTPVIEVKPQPGFSNRREKVVPEGETTFRVTEEW